MTADEENYIEKVSSYLKENYFCTSEELMIPPEDIVEGLHTHWTPEEWAEWYARKTDLIDFKTIF